MTVQTTVSAQPGTAYAGQIERSFRAPLVVSRICDEAAGFPFGVAVCRDGDDRKVDLPATGTDVTAGLVGFVAADMTKPYLAGGYANGDDVPVMYTGVICVLTEGAVAQGGAVYIRHTANGGNTQLGKARADADTANAGLLPNAKFLDTLSGAGLARVLRFGV